MEIMAEIRLQYPNLKLGKAHLAVDPWKITEKIVLHSGVQLALTIAEVPNDEGKPTLIVSKPGIITVSELKQSGRNWNFTVKATGIGKLFFFAMGSKGSLTNSVHVVAGIFEHHTDMTEDLIANVFRQGDGSKMRALMRMLHNNPGNYFNENSAYNIGKHGDLACGTVSKVGGRDVFHPSTNYAYKDYYKPLPHTMENGRKVWRITDRNQVKYDEKKLERGTKSIKARLKKGLPVVAGLAYIPGRSVDKFGYLQPTGSGGHSVLIVGSNADASKFLYIDVYGPDGSGDESLRGSILKYEGGPTGLDAFPDVCEYLGIFELKSEPLRGGKVLKQRPDTQAPHGMFDGDQFLEVVSGPLD